MSSTRVRGWLLVALQLALLAVIVLAPRRGAWPAPSYIRVLGIVIVVAGLAAVLLGSLSLGRSITPHPEPPAEAELRTSGAFRYVRHPIYSGVILLAAGLTITKSSLIAAAAFALLVIVLVAKARFEEKLLLARFEGYRRYAETTPRFMPRLVGRTREGR